MIQTILINTSIDIPIADKDLLLDCFDNKQFEIKHTIYKPGVGTTALILNFLFSAIVGGFIYDQFKSGLKRLLRKRNKLDKNQLIIKIKIEERVYKIVAEETEDIALTKENKLIKKFESLDSMFHDIDFFVQKSN